MSKRQRCQLLRITRSHYGKLQKISVFYGLWKTLIFPWEIFKNFSEASLQWILCRGVLSASTCRTLRIAMPFFLLLGVGQVTYSVIVKEADDILLFSVAVCYD